MYAPDRQLLRFARDGVTPMQRVAVDRMVRELTVPFFRAVGATYVYTLGPGSSPYGFDRFLDEHRAIFPPVARDGDYRLFRFVP
jgi:hypothetical protein